MAKSKSVYVCGSCGYESPKWLGKCPECQSWNTFEEEVRTELPAARKSVPAAAPQTPVSLSQIDPTDEPRFHTGLGELDRVLGGGIVKGSLVLLGGDPGIGKSTMLLQICAHLGQSLSILYVSGEESVRQLKLRADRLGVAADGISVLAANDVESICQTVRARQPQLVMIDSIQTMNMPGVTSSPGSVTQVRESTNAFMRLAKEEDIPILIVGHVNKDGAIAGPKVLEHIVDAVLHFEGDRNFSYRLLRAVKNRFGSTNEIGVFQMEDRGLTEVPNPSMLLLSGRPVQVSGSCVACVMEGTRPILAEVQALAAKTGFGTPRRTAAGFDYNRMNLLLAVLEKRAGYFFGNLDVYLNVVGGIRLDEPAADLSVALAIVSSVLDKPVDEHLIAFGELGLGGELRTVTALADRVREAARLGFTRAIVPRSAMTALQKGKPIDIELLPVSSVTEAIRLL